MKLKLKLGNTIISLIFLWSAHVGLYVRNGFGVFYVVFKAKIDIYKIYNYYYHHQKICLIPMLLLNFHNFHSYLSLLWSITFFILLLMPRMTVVCIEEVLPCSVRDLGTFIKEHLAVFDSISLTHWIWLQLVCLIHKYYLKWTNTTTQNTWKPQSKFTTNQVIRTNFTFLGGASQWSFGWSDNQA
jgi:hypothetical protein